jgi:hypothetical protein
MAAYRAAQPGADARAPADTVLGFVLAALITLRWSDGHFGHGPHTAEFALTHGSMGVGSARRCLRRAARAIGSPTRRRYPVGCLVRARIRAHGGGRTLAIAAAISVTPAILRATGRGEPRVAPGPVTETHGP